MRRVRSLVKGLTTFDSKRSLFQVGTLLILLIGGPCPYVSSQDSAQQLSKPASSLRTRVKEFYSFLKAGNWSKAENYVSRETLDTFRNQAKTPFESFEIDSVELQPGGARATVRVTTKLMTPYSTSPFPFPLTTHWRLVGGRWYVVVPNPPREPVKAMMRQAPADKGAPPQKPPVELKFEHTDLIVDSIQPGEVKLARFPFTNVSDHVVKIGKVVTGCDCLRLKDGKRDYKPGESGTLEFAWDPIHRDFNYALEDTIAVTTEPGGAVTFLMARTVVGPRVAGAAKNQSSK
jgi:uncharacterized protein DUF1573